MTSSPGPTPSASRTSTSASVPLATPTASRTPRYAAASRSNVATFGPRMKSALASTPSIASRMRGSSGSYCAFTSTSGIGRTPGESRGTQAAVNPERQQHQHEGDDDVLDVAEVVMEALVAAPRRPADAREGECPDGRPDRGQDHVATERHLEDPCRDRDEGADHGRHTPDEHREVVPAVEPALRAVEVVAREVEPPSVPLEQRAAAVAADRPADDRPDQIPERSRQCHHDESPEVRRDRGAEEDDA